MSEFYLDDKIEAWNFDERVKFCLFCCYKVKHLLDDDSLEALELVEKWLEDESSISEKNLLKTADAIYKYTVYSVRTVYNAIYYAVNRNYYSVYYTSYSAAVALNSSQKALYLEFMRGKLSDIMEN